jgi:hypothetical protein
MREREVLARCKGNRRDDARRSCHLIFPNSLLPLNPSGGCSRPAGYTTSCALGRNKAGRISALFDRAGEVWCFASGRRCCFSCGSYCWATVDTRCGGAILQVRLEGEGVVDLLMVPSGGLSLAEKLASAARLLTNRLGRFLSQPPHRRFRTAAPNPHRPSTQASGNSARCCWTGLRKVGEVCGADARICRNGLFWPRCPFRLFQPPSTAHPKLWPGVGDDDGQYLREIPRGGRGGSLSPTPKRRRHRASAEGRWAREREAAEGRKGQEDGTDTGERRVIALSYRPVAFSVRTKASRPWPMRLRVQACCGVDSPKVPGTHRTVPNTWAGPQRFRQLILARGVAIAGSHLVRTPGCSTKYVPLQ